MLVVDAVLFLGVCVGHAALLVFTLNRLYAMPLPHRFLTAMRLLHGLLAVTGPAALLFQYGVAVSQYGPSESSTVFDRIVFAYVVGCLLIGLVLLPVTTLLRLRRPKPAALLSNHTHTVDVAASLGYKPFGHGKRRLLARLPGNEIFRVDFAVRTLHLPRLPAAWDGLTILHLSDLHLHGSPDRAFFAHVMDLCRDWQPDLVAVTGDLVDSNRHHRWIVPLLGRLRWNIAAFAILGNHDSWRDPALIRRRLRRVGMRVLGNGWERIEVRGEPMVVIGHEGPWFRPEPDLNECPAGVFRLLLSHTPDNFAWARRNDIDLMLAGHNHGGQIRFPVIGSVFSPSLHGRRYDCGTFHEPPTVLHVNRGLSGQHPVRYNCRPEVAKLVLRCGAGDLTAAPRRE